MGACAEYESDHCRVIKYVASFEILVEELSCRSSLDSSTAHSLMIPLPFKCTERIQICQRCLPGKPSVDATTELRRLITRVRNSRNAEKAESHLIRWLSMVNLEKRVSDLVEIPVPLQSALRSPWSCGEVVGSGSGPELIQAVVLEKV